MTIITGKISKNGVVIAEDVKFTLVSQGTHGHKSTVGSFQLPSNFKVKIDMSDPMFDVELYDGRIGTIAISSRIADGAVQHFQIKALGL